MSAESRATAVANPAAARDVINVLRVLAMDAVQQANSGHPGMPMGMAEIAEVLWRHHLRHNPANPAGRKRRGRSSRPLDCGGSSGGWKTAQRGNGGDGWADRYSRSRATAI